MSDEELKKRAEEFLKLQEEGDRLFFVRLGRFALTAIGLASVVILPGIAIWRVFEQDVPTEHFWSNLGWLLLGNLYAFGALLIVYAIIYLAGGSRGLKLCGSDAIMDGSERPLFLAYPAAGCLLFGLLYSFGNATHILYLLIK